MKCYKLGIDVGGTHTDAVLVDNTGQIIAFYKSISTDSVNKGIEIAIQKVLYDARVQPDFLQAIFIGTTYALNALLQKNDLSRVGVIRISGVPNPISPCYDWPIDAREAMLAGCITISGGFLCDGNLLAPFDYNHTKREVVKFLQEYDMEGVAIVGAFSPINPEQEIFVKEIVYELKGENFFVTQSSDVGGINFIERENSAIINTALKSCMKKAFSSLEQNLRHLNIYCPVYFVQNNGMIQSIKKTIDNPVTTISSGATNSFLGGVKLAGLSDAVVVDIGGTSTDIGVVSGGFVRQSNESMDIGTIRFNFRAPDVSSLSIGGGSYIKRLHNGNLYLTGKSCGKNIKKEAIFFGGNELTLTDISVAAGCSSMQSDVIISIDKQDAGRCMKHIEEKIKTTIAKMRGHRTDLPIVLVGGGSSLFFNSELARLGIIPQNASVANAYGAACAEISGSVDVVCVMDDRDRVLDELIEEAKKEAISAGAHEGGLRVVYKEIIPYQYLSNNLARVKITVAGKMK